MALQRTPDASWTKRPQTAAARRRSVLFYVKAAWLVSVILLAVVMLGPSFVWLTVSSPPDQPAPRLNWSTKPGPIPVRAGTSHHLIILPHTDSSLVFRCTRPDGSPYEAQLGDFSWGMSSTLHLQVDGCKARGEGRVLRMGLGLLG